MFPSTSKRDETRHRLLLAIQIWLRATSPEHPPHAEPVAPEARGVHGHMMHTKLGTRLLRKGIDLSGLNPSLTPEFHTRVASVLTQRISLSVQTNSPRGAPRTDRRPSGNLRREVVVFRPPLKPTGAISQIRASPPAPAGPGCPYGLPYRRPHLQTTA